MQTKLYALLTALAALLAAPVHSETKGIVEAGESEADKQSLSISFEPTKAVFDVNEPIRFRVKGNERFFLYLYSVDERTGEARLFLPGGKQTTNQYEANRRYRVPNRGVKFVALEPGVEKIVMVASRRYVDIEAAQNADSVLAVDALERQFEEKGVVIRRRDDRRPPPAQTDVVVQETVINIRGQRDERAGDADRWAPAPGAPAANPFAFVATDQVSYKAGDAMQIAFGATARGYVHVVLVEPGGGTQQFLTQAVEPNRIYVEQAFAERPGGHHQFVAMFSESKELPEVAVAGGSQSELESDPLAMGVYGVRRDRHPDPAQPAQTSVYRFYVDSR